MNYGWLKSLIPARNPVGDYGFLQALGEAANQGLRNYPALGVGAILGKDLLLNPLMEGANLTRQAHKGDINLQEPKQTFRALLSGGNAMTGGFIAPVAGSALGSGMTKPFYSALTRAAEESALKSAPASQWLGTLKNTPGIKPEELDTMGLPDWLNSQTGPVTKQQLSDFVNANQVNVQDVLKGETGDRMVLPSGSVIDGPNDPRWQFAHPEVVNDTKFSQYQLPGGENYRELLLTLPPKGPGFDPSKVRLNFRGGHFDEPNVLAHVRFNDRTDVNGKKTLFLEEVQSDWHQKGRKEGYQLPSEVTAPMDAEYRQLVHKNADARAAGQEPDPADVARAKELEDALTRSDNSKIPNAPFKTTWPDLALKRMIKYAADNGYDQIAWTPGDVQAARYDLSKQISGIRWEPLIPEAGKGSMVMLDPATGGNLHPIRMQVDPSGKVTATYQSAADQFVGRDLSDVVGKEIADKIMSKGAGHLKDADLQVGGEGMKGFYDKMLPSVANKLGKKYGAKVGTTKIGGSSPEYHALEIKVNAGTASLAERQAYDRMASSGSKGTQQVWSLPITDAMKQQARTKGFPLFSGGLPLSSILGSALGKDKDQSLSEILSKAIAK